MKSAVGERANATVVTRVATSAGAGLLASALPLTPSGLSLGQQSSWCLAAYTKTHRTIAMGGSAVEDGSVLKLERRVNTSVAVAESGLVSLPQRTQGHTFGALRRNEPRVAVLRETLEGTAVGPGLAQETRMKTILLVDDHNLFRQVLAVVLKHRTVFKENIQAGSLAEARQILADRDVRFDLAIVDLDHSEGAQQNVSTNFTSSMFRCWRSPSARVWEGAPGPCKRGQPRFLIWPPTRRLSAW
jgi:hypothetical protein